MTPVELVVLALLGGLVGLDVVSFPQAMISRPIVAATIGGAVAGDVGAGLLAGAALEMVAMETLPVGASRYPEWGTASVVGGALAAAPDATGAGALLLAVFAALATAWVGGWSMYALRRLNGVWARRAQPGLDAGAWPTVVGLQLRGLTADVLRGVLLTLIALLVWTPVIATLLPRWTLAAQVSRGLLAATAAAVAGSAVWRLSHGTAAGARAGTARWYFVAGIAVGLIAVVLW